MSAFNHLGGSRCKFPWQEREENNGFLGGIPSRSRRKSNMKKHLKHTAYKLVIHAETRTFLVGNKSQALNGKIFKHLNAHLRCTQGGQASLKELPAGHQLPPAAALVSFLPNLHLLSDANGPPCCSCKKVHSHQGSHHLNKQHFVRKQSQAEKAFVYCVGSSAKYWQHYKTLAAVQNTGSSVKYWQQCKILAAV